MITEISGITNGRVMVVYDHYYKTVMVQNVVTGQYRAFSEHTDMWEAYKAFKEHFTDDVDYNTALDFFKPIQK
jgi:hypothetical protein